MFNWKNLSPEEDDKLIMQSLLSVGIKVCEGNQEGIQNPDVILENGEKISLNEYCLFDNCYNISSKDIITDFETKINSTDSFPANNNLQENYVCCIKDEYEDNTNLNSVIVIAA